jgi:nucleoid-associated protein EbfC
MKIQEQLGEEVVQATAGGGAVTIEMTGHQKVKSVKIDPEVLNPEDVELLEDMIVAAVNEAVAKSQELAAQRLGALTGGMRIPGMM